MKQATKPTTKQSPKTTPSPKTRKPVATKHGNGDLRTVAEVEDSFDRRYREWRMAQQYTKRDIVIAVVIAVLATVISTYLTSRWYGL